MIHILLTILKIVGILLALVTGLLLLLVLIVLFCPIRYRINGEIKEGSKNCLVRVTWLLRIFSINFQYPSEEGVSIKVFGRRITLDKEEKSKKNHKKAKSKIKNSKYKSDVTLVETVDKKIDSTRLEESAMEENSEHFETALKDSCFISLKKKIEKTWFKIKGLYGKINRIKTILEQEETKLFFSDSLGRIKRVWKRIKPRVLKVYGTFGLGEPDLTGQVYGLFWSVKPYLSKEFILVPDFDNKVFVCNFLIKGRITIFVILLNGCKIYFDKRFKKMLSQWNADERGVDNNGKEQSI